jgi:hypothetical protein
MLSWEKKQQAVTSDGLRKKVINKQGDTPEIGKTEGQIGCGALSLYRGPDADQNFIYFPYKWKVRQVINKNGNPLPMGKPQ